MKQKFANCNTMESQLEDSVANMKRLNNTEHQQSRGHKIELNRLRLALTEAIDENEIMRGRVIELEATLAALQLEMEEREQKFTEEI